MKRRLSAILAADVIGYTGLIETDEEGTLARLKAVRSDIADPRIAEGGGRIATSRVAGRVSRIKT